MRKVMIMNGKYIDHSGTGYKVKQKNWTQEETTYMVIDTFKTLKEVFQSLKVQYNQIEFCEGITEDEIQDLYFGFDNNIKENIRNHAKTHKFSNYKFTKEELEIVLQNMTMIHYYIVQGRFVFRPFLGKFGSHEQLNVEGKGSCFHKPTMMGKNKIKIVNSDFNYDGNAYLRLGYDSKSLELVISKGRRTIDLKFVPSFNKNSSFSHNSLQTPKFMI